MRGKIPVSPFLSASPLLSNNLTREDPIVITAIELEDSAEYAIWVSYMEVYNEKVSAPSSNAADAGSKMPYMY